MTTFSVDTTRFSVDSTLVLASATVYWATGLRPAAAGSGVRVVVAPNPPAQVGGSS